MTAGSDQHPAAAVIPLPDDLSHAAALIRNLIETRTFKKERLDDVDVREALQTLGQYARSADEAQWRLLAVSLLGKAGEVSKPVAAVVHKLIVTALNSPLPAVGDWGNAEDRYYLATAVSVSDEKWIPVYAARELAHVELAEKLSRDTWAALAIGRAQDLSSALETIAGALYDWLATRDDAVDLAYRKLVRICEGLTQVLLTADIPSGKDFGKAFTALVRQAGGGRGATTLRVREDAATSVLDLLIQILRLRFDVLFDSDLYRAAGLVRGWWHPARPPDGVEQRAGRIVRLAFDGLHILARQGLQNKELRQALTKSLNPMQVRAAGEAVAAADASLDPKVSKWLATGEELAEARANETVQELNEQEADELIARLLLTAGNQDVGADAMTSVADAIELFEPAQAALVRKASTRLAVVRKWVDALARKRRLATYAGRGELVAYDPAMHDAAGPLQLRSDVRVAVPGVLRTIEGRPPEIVIKAIVDAP